MRSWTPLAFALAATACSGTASAAPTESVDECLVAARSYAAPASAPCAQRLRESTADIATNWSSFTPYQRFFLREALGPTTTPPPPEDAAAEACAAVANAPAHWFGAPIISPTPLAAAVLTVPNIEGCLMPLVANETRESFLGDGEGNTVAQANALTRGDVAAWFVAQLRHESFALDEPDRAAHRMRLAAPVEPPPVAVATPPASPWAEVDDRLRGVHNTRDIRRHLVALRAADASELDVSCINEHFATFADRIDAFRGPNITRTSSCEENRCLLRIQSTGERSVSALNIWYTRDHATARSIRCEVLRGC